MRLPDLLCSVGALALACGTPESTPANDAGVATTSVVAAEVPEATGTDSTRIVLAGPTLIAFYPATPVAGPDTSEEMSTVMDDFSHHLSTASDSLRAIGFRVEMRPVDSVVVSDSGREIAFKPPQDSVDVGYYFAAPGRAPVIIYGVRTNMEIVQTARVFLTSNR